MTSVLSLLPLLVLLAADDDDARKDLAKFQGAWQPIKYVVDGKETKESDLNKIKLTVKDNVSTISRGGDTGKGSYTLNPGKSPKELDIKITAGDDKGKTYLAIYEFDGDDLKICLNRNGKTRPTKFESKKGTGDVLEVWKKKKI
jgi:uncharacterized protein (TIGR03067 family)